MQKAFPTILMILIILALPVVNAKSCQIPCEWLRTGTYATYVLKSTLPTGSREFEIAWTVQDLNQTHAVIEQKTRILGAKDLPGPFPRTYSVDTVRVDLANRDTYITLQREGTLSYIGKTEFWMPTNLTENSKLLIYNDWYNVEGREKLILNQTSYDVFLLRHTSNEETREYWFDSKTGLLIKYEVHQEYELNPQSGGGLFKRDDVGELVSTNLGSPLPYPGGSYLFAGIAAVISVVALLIIVKVRRARSRPKAVEPALPTNTPPAEDAESRNGHDHDL